jgi:hypothetical protein
MKEYNHKFISTQLPEKLAIELNKVNWEKVSPTEIFLLINFGLPYLEKKGKLKDEKAQKES